MLKRYSGAPLGKEDQAEVGTWLSPPAPHWLPSMTANGLGMYIYEAS
jgi:hypothetical protein